MRGRAVRPTRVLPGHSGRGARWLFGRFVSGHGARSWTVRPTRVLVGLFPGAAHFVCLAGLFPGTAHRNSGLCGISAAFDTGATACGLLERRVPTAASAPVCMPCSVPKKTPSARPFGAPCGAGRLGRPGCWPVILGAARVVCLASPFPGTAHGTERSGRFQARRTLAVCPARFQARRTETAACAAWQDRATCPVRLRVFPGSRTPQSAVRRGRR